MCASSKYIGFKKISSKKNQIHTPWMNQNKMYICSLEGVKAYESWFLFKSLFVHRYLCSKMNTATPTQFPRLMNNTKKKKKNQTFMGFVLITHAIKTWSLGGLHLAGSSPHTQKPCFRGFTHQNHMNFLIHTNPTSWTP